MTFAVRPLRQGGAVNITDETASDNSLAGTGGFAAATYQLNSDGVAYHSVLSPFPLIPIPNNWLLAGAPSDFEVYATVTGSGGVIVGPIGSWVSLGTTTEWNLTGLDTLATRVLDVQIRDASTGVVLDTATITLFIDSVP